MHTTKSRRSFALAAVFGFIAPAARAEIITPDSIPNPPAAVGSANDTSVYSGSTVTTQYNGLGLNFTGGTTITNLNGVSVWAPTEGLAQPDSRVAGAPPPNDPTAQISYYGTWSGIGFVQPGSMKSAVATSLSVDIIGPVNMGPRVSYANYPGGMAIPAHIVMAPAPNGGTWETFPIGPGITGFSVFAPDPVDPPLNGNPAWGVAGVSFTLASAPEPSSLLLGGLGALGLAARFGWRRTRGAIA